MENGIIIALALAVLFLITFFPSFIAFMKKYHNMERFSVSTYLNVFLGWTLIGWVVALVWALSKPPEVRVINTRE